MNAKQRHKDEGRFQQLPVERKEKDTEEITGWNETPSQSISYLGCLSHIISFCLNMLPWLVLYILHLQKHCVHLQFQAISSLVMCDTTPSILQHVSLSRYISLWDADVGTGDEGTKTSLSQTIHYFGSGTWKEGEGVTWT